MHLPAQCAALRRWTPLTPTPCHVPLLFLCLLAPAEVTTVDGQAEATVHQQAAETGGNTKSSQREGARDFQ